MKHEPIETENLERHPIRRLLFFQLKLGVDAVRDIVLSPISIVCTIADIIGKRRGKQSYFEMLLIFGRDSDERINLFESHQSDKKSLEQMVEKIEAVVVKEYKNPQLSKKTRLALIEIIEKSNPNKHDD